MERSRTNWRSRVEEDRLQASRGEHRSRSRRLAVGDSSSSRSPRSSADWHQAALAARGRGDRGRALHTTRAFTLLLGVKEARGRVLNWDGPGRASKAGGSTGPSRRNSCRRPETPGIPALRLSVCPPIRRWRRRSGSSSISSSASMDVHSAVFCYLHRHGIKLPSRGPSERELIGCCPATAMCSYTRTTPSMREPTRTDAKSVTLVDGKCTKDDKQPQESWTVVRAGTIWATSHWRNAANQKKLRDNRTVFRSVRLSRSFFWLATYSSHSM